ncbi:hypothetical protein Efla_006489 [Eimeria flavescens]
MHSQDFDDDSLYADADDVLTILEEFQEAKASAEFTLSKEKRERRRGKLYSPAESLERLKNEIRRRWATLPEPLPPHRQKLWELLLSLYQTHLKDLQRLSQLTKQMLQQQLSAVSMQKRLREAGAAATQQQQQQ